MKQDMEQIPIPEGLEERLSRMIDQLDALEQHRKRRQLRLQRLSAAAAIAIIAGCAWWWVQAPTQPAPDNHEQQLAYAEACRALEMVSTNFNKGVAQWQKANQELVNTNKKIKTIIHKKQ